MFVVLKNCLRFRVTAQSVISILFTMSATSQQSGNDSHARFNVVFDVYMNSENDSILQTVFYCRVLGLLAAETNGKALHCRIQTPNVMVCCLSGDHR